MPASEGFRAGKVCNLTGLTHRQLDHWDRTKLFRPSLAQADGRGNARFYSFLDVVELRVMKRLLDAGLSTRRLRGCLAYLKENLHEDKLAGLTLVAHGTELYLLTEDPGRAIDLARQGQVAWILDIPTLVEEIDDMLSSERESAMARG